MAFKMKKFSGFGNKKTPLKKEEEKEKTSNFDKFATIGKLQAEGKEVARKGSKKIGLKDVL